MSTQARQQIQKARLEGRLSAAEKANLDDMLNADWPWAPGRALFAAQYLPAPCRLAAMKRTGGLMTSPADTAAVARRLKTDPLSAAMLVELERRCGEYRRPGSPTSIDWREQKKEILWNSRKGHWLFGKALQELAWGWAFTGRAAYAVEVKGILLALARNRQGWKPLGCNYGRPYNGWLNDNLLDLGHATLGPAIAYSLLRGRFTAAERQEMAAYYEPFFCRALGYRYDGVDKPGHNFAPVGYSGIGLMALALAEDIPAARRGVLEDALAWAEAYARFTLDHVGGKDGAAVEGSAYGSASLHYIAQFAEGLLRRFGRNLFAHPAWGRFARYLAMETLPGGGAFNNFNDNHYRTHVSFWPLVSRRTGDPAGHWIWNSQQLAKGAPSWLDEGRLGSLADLPYVLLHREPAADALTARALKLPTVHLFPDQQHLVARTGWEKNDLHVTFQCTRGRKGGHNQADRLNVTMYALGERFLVDSGYGLQPIPGSTEVKRLGTLAESHNQVLVDGKGQVTTIAPEACRILGWGRQNGWVWALADAAPSYQKMRIARRLVAVRLDAKSPCLVMADWLVPAEPGVHRFTWLLHTAPGNRFVLGKAGAFQIAGTGGQSLNAIHRQAGHIRLTQDEWIDHPRLRAESRGKAFLGLTILGADKPKVLATLSSLSSEWASLSWKPGLTHPRLALPEAGLELTLF